MMAMMVRLTLPLISLVMMSGVFGENYNVTYDTTTICALKGSTVNMSCSYKYPEEFTLNNTFWMKCKTRNETIISLEEYPEYKDRVEYIEDRPSKTATLRLHNVTENDENTYCFRLTTKTDGKKWIGYPGIQLQVSEFRVKIPEVVIEGKSAVLFCEPTCNFTERIEYTWFKNSKPFSRSLSTNKLLLKSVSSDDTGNYSCAVTQHEHLPSPALTLTVRWAWNVMYVTGLCVIIGTAAGFGILFLLIIVIRCTYILKSRNKRRNDDSKDTKLKKQTSAGKVSTSGDGDEGLSATVQHQDKVMKKPDEDEIQYASVKVHRNATETKSPQSQENDFSVIYSGLTRQADPLSF